MLTSTSLTSKEVFPEKVPATIFLDWPVRAIVTVDMHSLLEHTDSNSVEKNSPNINDNILLNNDSYCGYKAVKRVFVIHIHTLHRL